VLNFDRSHYSPVDPRAVDAAPTSLGHASFTWISDPDGFAYEHRLNLYGFRDGEWPLRAADGTTRVAFVGDSFVEGFSTDAQETLPASFERRARAGGAAVSTQNLGIGGASLENYARLIRDAVPLFEPAAVVLVLYANDLVPVGFDPEELGDPFHPKRAEAWQPRLLGVVGEMRESGRAARRWVEAPFPYLPAVPDPRNPWSHERRATALARFVAPEIATAMRGGRFNPALADWFSWARKALVQPVDLTPLLAALARQTAEAGSRLFVVYVPAKSQVTDRYLAYQAEYSPPDSAASLTGEAYQVHGAWLARSCAGLEIPFLDLTAFLRGLEGSGPEQFWPYDDHLRPHGYRAVGEHLADWWLGER